MFHFPAKFRFVLLVAAAFGAAGAGPAFSHGVYVAPAHTTAHYGGHGYSGGHGGLGGFFRALFGISEPQTVVQVQPVLYGQTFAAMPYGEVAEPSAGRPDIAPAVQSDEERYRIATGLALPPRHDLVVVPPATARGDATYIWSNIGAE